MKILNYLDHSIETTHWFTDEMWLEERKKGIGGSDIAVVMGLSKYKSKLRLYKEKVENFKEDLSENVFIKKGKDLEDLIRVKYCVPYFQKLGYRIIKDDVILNRPDYPMLKANLDAFAVPEIFTGNYAENIVVEIKWVSEYGEANWDGDDYLGVPVGYYAQVQHYMFVTGARKAIICALFDRNWQMKFYEIPFNPDFVAKMITETIDFMDNHILPKVPPTIDSELDKPFITEALKANADIPTTTNNLMDEKIIVYKELKQNIKTLEKGVNDILSELTEMYLKGERPYSPVCRINISVVKSMRFNTTAFEKDYPDLYKQYLQQSEYSRTTIK